MRRHHLSGLLWLTCYFIFLAPAMLVLEHLMFDAYLFPSLFKLDKDSLFEYLTGSKNTKYVLKT